MTDEIEHGPGTLEAGAAAPSAADPEVAGPVSRDPAHAAETRRLYAADWADFVGWCRTGRHAALPAAPATLAAYLGSLATTLGHGALARRAAAIADRHRRGGHPPPGTDPVVRAVLRTARAARRLVNQVRPAAPDASSLTMHAHRLPPPKPAQLARMAARCPGDLLGLRDRALLLLTAAGLGGERLLALHYEHVRFTGQGAELTVAGADGLEGRGGDAVVLRRIATPTACPVRALEDWLRRSDTRFGPVFRKVDRWGNVEHRRLRSDALRRIWQRRAKAVRTSRRTKADVP